MGDAPTGRRWHYTTGDLAWNAFNGIEGTLMSYVLISRLSVSTYWLRF